MVSNICLTEANGKPMYVEPKKFRVVRKSPFGAGSTVFVTGLGSQEVTETPSVIADMVGGLAMLHEKDEVEIFVHPKVRAIKSAPVGEGSILYTSAGPVHVVEDPESVSQVLSSVEA